VTPTFIYLLLFGVGLWAGIQNALAGGGTFLTLPALMLTGMTALRYRPKSLPGNSNACTRIDVHANPRGPALGPSTIALPDAASRRIRIPLR